MPQLAVTETPAEQANRVALPGEINGDFVDRFTLAHVAYGAAAQRYGLSFATTMALAVAFEALERPLKEAFPGKFPNPTQGSVPNMIGDVLAAGVGWGASRWLRRR